MSEWFRKRLSHSSEKENNIKRNEKRLQQHESSVNRVCKGLQSLDQSKCTLLGLIAKEEKELSHETTLSLNDLIEKIKNIQTAKDDLLKTFEDLESSTVGSVLAENNFSVQEDCNVLKRIEGRSDSDMKQSIENLERENKDLKQKIIKLEQKSSKPSPKVRIQIFAQGGEIPTKISKELESMLGARMNTKSSHLQICTVNSYDKILFDLPLLVICITSSRLGTDAIKAINDIPEQAKGKTTLIMFHHKNENSLPKQLSKYVLTTDEFRELGAVCDMAFWKNEGIYPCDFNYKALDKIIAFIENA